MPKGGPEGKSGNAARPPGSYHFTGTLRRAPKRFR